jgi:hypothetical protein
MQMSLKASTLVWDHSNATGTSRLVMLALADHADGGMVAWPSVSTLASMCRTGERNVHKILSALVDAGEIKPIGKGIRGVVKYRLTPGGRSRQDAATPEHSDRGDEGAPLNARTEVGGPTPEPQDRGQEAPPLNASSPLNQRSPLNARSLTPERTFTPPLNASSDEPSLNRQEPRSGGGRAHTHEGGPSASSGDPDSDVATETARAILRHWSAEVTRLWGGDPSPRSPTNALATVKAWVREGVPFDLVQTVITEGLERKRQRGEGPPGSPAYVKNSMRDALAQLRHAEQHPEVTTGGRPHAQHRTQHGHDTHSGFFAGFADVAGYGSD